MKTPDHTTSPWHHAATLTLEPGPPGWGAVDVCVVGAGIAGLTTAYLLAKAGRRVILLDEGRIGGGETSRTSAHLASAIDNRMTKMELVHGEGGAKLAVASHAAAIDLIESIARDEHIDCDFARLPAYLLASNDAEREELAREGAAARRAGLSAEFVERGPLPGLAGPALRFANQGRFEPMKYMAGLADAARLEGVRMRGGCRVTEVRGARARAGESPTAVLSDGEIVEAEAIVVATNTPGPIVAWSGVYFKQAAYRTYMIGIHIPRGAIADALYWDTADPYHYARVVAASEGGDDVLLVGGEDHRTGQIPADHAPFEALERWARASFPPLGDVVSRWSGQVLEPTDGLAFIGRVPSVGDGVFVITGDSGMGLTHGTLGARLVADLVLGHPNPWRELYDPQRKPMHTLGAYATENLNTAAQWLDHVTSGDTRDVDTIAPGCGAIVRKGLSKLAVYRDDRGELHTCSAVCPHLGAVVEWNPIERSWDCPAHGSRFAATGEALAGPATTDLPRP